MAAVARRCGRERGFGMEVANVEAKRRLEKCSGCCIAPALFGESPHVNAGVNCLVCGNLAMIDGFAATNFSHRTAIVIHAFKRCLRVARSWGVEREVRLDDAPVLTATLTLWGKREILHHCAAGQSGSCVQLPGPTTNRGGHRWKLPSPGLHLVQSR